MQGTFVSNWNYCEGTLARYALVFLRSCMTMPLTRAREPDCKGGKSNADHR